MLYILNLYSAVCQLHLNTTGRKNPIKIKEQLDLFCFVFQEKREKISNCLAVACFTVAKSPL